MECDQEVLHTVFLSSGGQDCDVSEGKQRENRHGIWQKRFWEHVIEDEDDFETHFDDIHYNPVRHELVSCPRDWEASSFHCWVEKGVYPANWACGSNRRPTFAKNTDEFWEPV